VHIYGSSGTGRWLRCARWWDYDYDYDMRGFEHKHDKLRFMRNRMRHWLELQRGPVLMPDRPDSVCNWVLLRKRQLCRPHLEHDQLRSMWKAVHRDDSAVLERHMCHSVFPWRDRVQWQLCQSKNR